MKRKSISLIIGLMSFELLGVVAMQYYFLRESYSLKSQLFDQSVNDALNNVSDKLERKEVMVYLTQRAEEQGKSKRFNHKKNPVAEVNQPIVNTHRYSEIDRKRLEEEKAIIAFVKSMKANQEKSDSLFRLRDSILRSRYPARLVYNGPVYPEQ